MNNKYLRLRNSWSNTIKYGSTRLLRPHRLLRLLRLSMVVPKGNLGHLRLTRDVPARENCALDSVVRGVLCGLRADPQCVRSLKDDNKFGRFSF